ncbi:urea carboxylase [Microlunatus sp. GCM10028923]|uniref:urea carboxylase n=1 Tax=Microlunatus sp. GCM10028923 TaxID=3273400 RepID=UPI0036183B64
MFETLLIANRGEIACRIIRTAAELGCKTVAVYSDADATAPHVRQADAAVRLGPAAPTESYLRGEAVIEAALATGAGAVHPGYGFLSERAEFAEAVRDAGLIFVGPTPDQLRLFGDKQSARAAARAAGVPLAQGSGALDSADAAVAAAERIGYPVMIKAAAGGGGIGLAVARDADEVIAGYASVARLAGVNFGSGGIFCERYVERARHVEVQLFGAGDGRMITLGTRDCTLQRRNQKVIEEAPAFGLTPDLERRLIDSAAALTGAVRYRSAGTAEFLLDLDRDEIAFLEVNSRLQVEHPVTELITGVDLVGWMIRLAQGDDGMFDEPAPAITGHAVEARVYAEDPAADYRPSAGLLTEVVLPGDATSATGERIRTDGWVETGSVISTHYDPMLAKIITGGPDRAAAYDRLAGALAGTRISGVASNLDQLRAAAADPWIRDGAHTTATLALITGDRAPRIDVLRAGAQTTVQDLPGRLGYWEVGLPPSGPMDDLSFRLANRAVGNPAGAPGLELTLTGPRLRFATDAVVCVAGARTEVTLDGRPFPMWRPIPVPAGSELDLGTIGGPGLRSYLAVRGGLAVPDYLGSAATFALGGFGGYTGAAVAAGDVLRIAAPGPELTEPAPVPREDRPELVEEWQLAVSEGPQPAPEYFTAADLEQFYRVAWTVQAHANRTGIRLSGPRPAWARQDGGEAGLHPSNLHDNAYSVGSLNVSGDTPILLGPDGPSLGGFACPLTVIPAHRWKLGQIRPGDRVRFVPVDEPAAADLRQAPERARSVLPERFRTGADHDHGVLHRLPAADGRPAVTYRRGAEDNLLVEYGEMILDLGLRLRVHALTAALREQQLDGLIDLTPGVRSLHLHTDPDRLGLRRLLGILIELERDLPATDDLAVPSRRIRLPLSFDDPAVTEAIHRYLTSVRPEAPWLPSNLEFIRRINGLDSVDDVAKIVFGADYLVLGLGDVYLGAPLAVPLDPRHRLVTTKYNPARTWTAADTVGLGGQYLCVYGMDSPGGYQLIGRTVPIWSGYRQAGAFEAGKPWLFRFFDKINWYPVEPGELHDLRAEFAAGRLEVEVDEGRFSLAEQRRLLAGQEAEIAAFRAKQQAAFDTEREAWRAAGEFDVTEPEPTASGLGAAEAPDGCELVPAPMAAGVWRIGVEPGQTIEAGEVIVILEAMKMELPVISDRRAVVREVLVRPGAQVAPGTPLAVIEPA